MALAEASAGGCVATLKPPVGRQGVRTGPGGVLGPEGTTVQPEKGFGVERRHAKRLRAGTPRRSRWLVDDKSLKEVGALEAFFISQEFEELLKEPQLEK